MAEAMLFSFICMAVGGFLGLASVFMFVSLPNGMPRTVKKAWAQVPKYRNAIICLILGLLITFIGVIPLLSY